MRDVLQRLLQPPLQPPAQGMLVGITPAPDASSAYPPSEAQARTRVSLQLRLADADELQRRAQTAALSLAAWVLHVTRSGHEPVSAEQRAARIAALTQSNAEAGHAGPEHRAPERLAPPGRGAYRTGIPAYVGQRSG